MPLSVTFTSQLPWARASVVVMTPPREVNFTALLSRFQMTCCSRCRSPNTRQAWVGQLLLQSHALGIGRGLHGLERRLHDLRQIGFFRIQAQPATQQAAHVDQIIDQLGEYAYVAIDGLAAALHVLGREAPGFKQARPAEHGMQRGAQLVSQRRQELILESADALRFRAQRPLVGETLAQVLGFLAAVTVHAAPIIAPPAAAHR